MEKGVKELNFKDYLDIVLRRKYTILLIFFSVLVPLVFYVRTMPDTFTTKSQLVVEDQKYSSFAQDMPMMLRNTRSFNFYQGIFRSRSFLQAILDSLGRDAFKADVEDTSQEAVRTFISASISIQQTDYESFISISARAPRAGLAYDLARMATQIFKEMCRQVVAEEEENTVKETEKQLNLIRDKLETAERDFRQYGDKIGASAAGVADELKHLQTRYYELRTEQASKEAVCEANQRLLASLEKKIEPKGPDTRNSADYLKAKEDLRQKEKEKKRLESMGLTLSTSSAVNEDILRLEQDIIRLGSREERVDPRVVAQWQKMRTIVAENEMELDILKSNLTVYERKIESYKRTHPDELAQSLELSTLERARKVYEDTYNVLLEKMEMAKIRRAAQTGGLTVIDPVFYPTQPVARNEAAFYIVGVAVGLLLSLGFVFLREFLDTTIKSNSDLENHFEVPIIGTIPHIDFAKKSEMEIKRKSSMGGDKETVTAYPRELINFYKDESVVAEAFRALRTNLFFASPDNPIRSLAITSSGPHEGKSLTASNLCLACAQMGKRTLLVDADLRRPVIHHLFQLPRENGFTDLFIGRELASVTKKTAMENLDIITAGRFTPNPSELLASKKMEKIIEEIKSVYDLVLFDTPPVMAVTDAPVISTKVDGMIMVVKSYSTDQNVLERAVLTMENINARIVGFVLNDIDLTHRYASYGYYKYYYHYYRSQKD